MKIIKKEFIHFSEYESDTLSEVSKICLDIVSKSENSELQKLAQEIYEKIAELWEYDE